MMFRVILCMSPLEKVVLEKVVLEKVVLEKTCDL